MHKPISIDYDFSSLLDIDWNDHLTHYISFKKVENTETMKRFGSYPSTLTDDNTYIYQKFFDADEVDLALLQKQTNLTIHSISIIKQVPGTMIPIHHDHFYKLRQKYPNEADRAVRANIFLQDWIWGHFFQIDDQSISNWKQNTGFIFDNKVIHSSANASFLDKYTLQLTGFLND